MPTRCQVCVSSMVLGWVVFWGYSKHSLRGVLDFLFAGSVWAVRSPSQPMRLGPGVEWGCSRSCRSWKWVSVSRQRDFSNGSSRMHLWKVCHLMQGCGQQGLKATAGSVSALLRESLHRFPRFLSVWRTLPLSWPSLAFWASLLSMTKPWEGIFLA